MNETKFECVSLSLIDEVGGDFGIMITLPTGECRELHSVCVDRHAAQHICETVNRSGVSKHHIYDVIEDLLP